MFEIYKGSWYKSCCVLDIKLTNRALCPVIYVVANPVHGLPDRTRSEDHLQSCNESMNTKNKQIQGNNDPKHMPENDRRRAL